MTATPREPLKPWQDHERVVHALSNADKYVQEYKDEGHPLIILASAYRSLLAQQQWRPIESAPRDGKELIGWDGKDMFVCRWIKGYNVWGHESYQGHPNHSVKVFGEVYPTHWMPKPPPPEEKGG